MQNLQENTWTDEEVKRFWDYQSTIPENYFTYQIGDKLVDFFREYIKDDIFVLDYGAGAGFFSEQVLKKTNAKITSCDFSPESVKKEIERCSKYHNYQGGYTVDELIKQNKKFDLIFLF
ncbi:MAG: methyltransferase domain-containing protein [Alphaproteobacteria bacterium]|nr:methyltransferase domain-containing protein [Alphaproteobacteria bacterium]